MDFGGGGKPFSPCVDAVDLGAEIEDVHSDTRVETLQIAEVGIGEDLPEAEEKGEDVALRTKDDGADAEEPADE